MNIVTTRVADLSSSLELPEVPAAVDEIRRVVTVFRELRSGVTADGRTKIKSPSGTLSTAEAISVITSGLLCQHISAMASSGQPTLLPASWGRWSRTRSLIRWRGVSTSRWSPGSGKAGLSSTPPAATSRDLHARSCG